MMLVEASKDLVTNRTHKAEKSNRLIYVCAISKEPLQRGFNNAREIGNLFEKFFGIVWRPSELLKKFQTFKPNLAVGGLKRLDPQSDISSEQLGWAILWAKAYLVQKIKANG